METNGKRGSSVSDKVLTEQQVPPVNKDTKLPQNGKKRSNVTEGMPNAKQLSAAANSRLKTSTSKEPKVPTSQRTRELLFDSVSALESLKKASKTLHQANFTKTMPGPTRGKKVKPMRDPLSKLGMIQSLAGPILASPKLKPARRIGISEIGSKPKQICPVDLSLVKSSLHSQSKPDSLALNPTYGSRNRKSQSYKRKLGKMWIGSERYYRTDSSIDSHLYCNLPHTEYSQKTRLSREEDYLLRGISSHSARLSSRTKDTKVPKHIGLKSPAKLYNKYAGSDRKPIACADPELERVEGLTQSGLRHTAPASSQDCILSQSLVGATAAQPSLAADEQQMSFKTLKKSSTGPSHTSKVVQSPTFEALQLKLVQERRYFTAELAAKDQQIRELQLKLEKANKVSV